MYNLQTLRLLPMAPGTVKYPSRMTIEVTLGPPQAFGMADAPGRTFVVGPDRNIELSVKSFTGRTLFRPMPPLEPLKVEFAIETDIIELSGNIVRYTAECSDPIELSGAINTFLFALLPLLNLVYDEPPVIDFIKVLLGDVAFRIEHIGANAAFVATTWEKLCQDFELSIRRIQLFGPKNDGRRLQRALHYFHMACRLRVAGNSDWEFMAEAVLNLAKILEVLFKKSDKPNDDIRTELRTLGYDDAAIERDFITVMFLRNAFDVGHPRLVAMPHDELQSLYPFLIHAFKEFRQLLTLIVEKVEKAEYTARPCDNATLADSDDKLTWDRIIENIRSVKPQSPPPQQPCNGN